ncbi:hypothetical protein NQ317_012120 [Molorchus minor]|uniref:Uncharacterized protein n=1 Tax=Molorchus minor TaxID=1323400 RepID=A0ABQ9J9D4_9CUCU|nr:hypothetical protein NQ317_012120 [Molorchus minor]
MPWEENLGHPALHLYSTDQTSAQPLFKRRLSKKVGMSTIGPYERIDDQTLSFLRFTNTRIELFLFFSRQTLENVLSKSRSQGAFSNEAEQLPPKKIVNIRRSHTQNEMPRTIADLRAKLQERGESEWRKRVPQGNNATDELKLLKEKNRYNGSENVVTATFNKMVTIKMAWALLLWDMLYTVGSCKINEVSISINEAYSS